MNQTTIIHGDCMEYMNRCADKFFDLAIVDPPYGIGITKQLKKTISSESSMMKGCNGIKGGDWDENIPDKEYFSELNRVSKNQIIWGGELFSGLPRCHKVFLYMGQDEWA